MIKKLIPTAVMLLSLPVSAFAEVVIRLSFVDAVHDVPITLTATIERGYWDSDIHQKTQRVMSGEKKVPLGLNRWNAYGTLIFKENEIPVCTVGVEYTRSNSIELGFWGPKCDPTDAGRQYVAGIRYLTNQDVELTLQKRAG